MKLRVGYELVYQCPQWTPMLLMLNVHSSRVGDVLVPDRINVFPAVPIKQYYDSFGNLCSRIVSPPGQLTLSTYALLEVPEYPEVHTPYSYQHPVEELPDECLQFLLGSRYCESDLLSNDAWQMSRLGSSIQAIRDNEEAAASVGVRVSVTKRIIFVTAAIGCALAGGLWLATFTTFQPRSFFGIQWSAYMIFMVLVGGIGRFEGPILGAIIFFLIELWFGTAGVWYLIVLGLTALLFSLFLPRGIWGYVEDRFHVLLLPVGYRVRMPGPSASGDVPRNCLLRRQSQHRPIGDKRMALLQSLEPSISRKAAPRISTRINIRALLSDTAAPR